MAANLTNIAVTTRRAIRYGIYFIVIFLIGRLLLSLVLDIGRTIFPPPPPPPTVAFNRLSALPFPAKENLPTFSYTLETPSGALPRFPTQRIVYFMPKTASSLTSLEDARAKASAMGFTAEPIQINSNIYRFTNPESQATLEMNIINGTFSISYDLGRDPVPLTGQPPAPQLANAQVTAFLNRGSSNPEDLTGESDLPPQFFKYGAQGITTAISLSEANLIRVNLWRKDFDELPPKTPDPTLANVWFLLSSETRGTRQVIAAEFHYFPVDEDQNSTYPTKTSQEAWEDLQAGNAFIARLGENQDGNVVIRRVYQAYYDAGVYTEFYQPIFVFEGDRNFVAYVPAVTDQYYGN